MIWTSRQREKGGTKARTHGGTEGKTGLALVPRRGFTLIELLTAMGIIVLVIGMTIPLFESFRGSRSVDAGQNVMSAMLQRARSRAIGLQQRRGVFFYEDAGTGQVAMTFVKTDPTAATGYVQILVDPDIDQVERMPVGVGAATLVTAPVNTGNPSMTPSFRPFGLVLFDPLGRVEIRTYTFSNLDTGLATRCGFTVASSAPLVSHTGLALFDKRVFASVDTTNSQTFSVSGVMLARTFGDNQAQWLNQNATVLLVNRYNGTLVRAD